VREAHQKGTTDMARKRTQDDPAFTCTVVMESVQRETTLEEVCRTVEVCASVVSRWRQAFHQRGPEVLSNQRDPQSRRNAHGEEPGETPEDLKS
jgi:transposase-like protein